MLFIDDDSHVASFDARDHPELAEQSLVAHAVCRGIGALEEDFTLRLAAGLFAHPI
jgi:hypothetical protein